MGVTPGWGGAAQLVDLVGKREALKTLASSKKIHPTQALEMGLVDEIIPQDTVSSKGSFQLCFPPKTFSPLITTRCPPTFYALKLFFIDFSLNDFLSG